MLVERVHGFRRFDDAVEHGDALLAADVNALVSRRPSTRRSMLLSPVWMRARC